MDPYQTPKAEELPVKEKSDFVPPKPITCKYCGSKDTSEYGDLVDKPGIIKFLFFGLYYLLFRSAFKRKDIYCKSCGASYRDRSLWSYIALLLLILGIFLLVCTR